MDHRVNCFIAKPEEGDDDKEYIFKKMKKCKCFVAFATREYAWFKEKYDYVRACPVS